MLYYHLKRLTMKLSKLISKMGKFQKF